MATREQISAQITSLERQVRVLTDKIDLITQALDLQPLGQQHRTDAEKGTFLPGTGWTDDRSTRHEVLEGERGAPVVEIPS